MVSDTILQDKICPHPKNKYSYGDDVSRYAGGSSTYMCVAQGAEGAFDAILCMCSSFRKRN